MQGKNELKLCAAEMIEAVQYYLNARVFKSTSQVKVSSVTEQKELNCPIFVVKLKEAEATDDEE